MSSNVEGFKAMISGLIRSARAPHRLSQADLPAAPAKRPSICESGGAWEPSRIPTSGICFTSSINALAYFSFRYEQAGDMFVGRTVAGLPLGSPDFSILPPHFIESQDDLVKACFPGAPVKIFRVLEMCLASAVWHLPFLKEIMAASSAFFSSPLFTAFNIAELAKKVVCRRPTPDDAITATGVPPHVDLLCTVSRIENHLAKVIPAIDQVAPNTVEGITAVLEERAIQASSVTPHQLREVLASEIKAAGVPELKHMVEVLQQKLQSSASLSSQLALPPISTLASALPLNRYASFPENYAIPVCSPLNAWLLYVLGDTSRHLPPLRGIDSKLLPNRKVRRRLSDLRFLMGRIESFLRDQNLWVERPTLAQASEMFSQAEDAIAVPHVPGQKSRRLGQLVWTTLVKKIRLAGSAAE